MDFFAPRADIRKRLLPQEVGLGYPRLGQPTTTLLGGELQRIKLAYHLVREKSKRILYLFDEPTIGLHGDDVSILLRCFQKLVEEGHTVIVVRMIIWFLDVAARRALLCRFIHPTRVRKYKSRQKKDVKDNCRSLLVAETTHKPQRC